MRLRNRSLFGTPAALRGMQSRDVLGSPLSKRTVALFTVEFVGDYFRNKSLLILLVSAQCLRPY